MSLLYLRVDRKPSVFLSRSIYGAEIVMGDEANALTVGVGRRTLFSPPKNAFSTMHFESAHPMLARAKVWPDVSEHGPLPDDLLEEIGK